MTTVLVGMSGGMDSTAAAAFFKDEGFDVIGLHLQLYKNDSIANERFKKICAELNIRGYIADERQTFRSHIIDYFINTYKNGQTPNPCALCNRLIKFPLLNKYAEEFKCRFISTGHYARIERDKIYKAYDLSKDQSYFLSLVNKQHLHNFINSMTAVSKKTEIMEYLKQKGLEFYDAKESQEICFVDNKYTSFLENEGGMKPKKGFFLDSKGNVIGIHNGYYHYTIGKRKGLTQGFSERMYVKSIDAANDTVTLAKRDELSYSSLSMEILEQFDTYEQEKLTIKTRFRQKETGCKILSYTNKTVNVGFDHPIDAVAPGQIAVIYKNDFVVCSGIIQKPL